MSFHTQDCVQFCVFIIIILSPLLYDPKRREDEEARKDSREISCQKGGTWTRRWRERSLDRRYARYFQTVLARQAKNMLKVQSTVMHLGRRYEEEAKWSCFQLPPVAISQRNYQAKLKTAAPESQYQPIVPRPCKGITTKTIKTRWYWSGKAPFQECQ